MKKVHFVALSLLISCVILGSLMVFNNSSSSEGKINVGGKHFEEDYIDDLRQRTVELIPFIEDGLKEKDINVRLSAIEFDVENFPKLLIYINPVASSQEGREVVERKVNDIVQLAKEKSLLQENEDYEIIVREQKKNTTNSLSIEEYSNINLLIQEDLKEVFKDYKTSGYITIDNKLIRIQTSMQSSNKSINDLGNEIQKLVGDVLESKNETSPVEIYSEDGEKIN
ncbi:hypothetical protein [Halobacillus naozhouensis]|uniref:Stage III sporulation protein AH n=1 Tax=Halobacillus naozhouensis TaxID=554880 RepID=A0ABY8IVY9_9BACI|nr:hypothetical protein [Halobacillus naozhouensis]WFT74170.1 hypothetical protein P9989_17665 [Halobacillus naozhouensis]